MSNLPLRSFAIEGFRGIRQLDIPDIGRVNLIVGKNSCGKTSVLEAIQIYSGRGSWASFTSVLSGRNDPIRARVRDRDQYGEIFESFKNLFHYADHLEKGGRGISLGPVGSSERNLRIRLSKYRAELSEDGRQLKYLDDPIESSINDGVGLTVSFGEKSRMYPFDLSERFFGPIARDFEELEGDPCVSVSTSGLDEERMGRLWDRITLTEAEDQVISALRIISPKLERISLVQQGGSKARSFMVRVEGVGRPMPLRIMGDGLSRLMGIALALVSARDGFLLVDEIENGLHYSVQEAVWRLIFETAQKLNVQVFAATHSWDCVRAFQKAAVWDVHEQAYLLRVQESLGGVRIVPFTEDELTIAARDGIEVR